MADRSTLAGCLLAVLLCACAEKPEAQRAAPSAADVDAARLAAAGSDPDNWMSHGRTYAEERFSPLTMINDGNVQDLGLAWYFESDSNVGTEATPLVVDGVLYTTGTWNVLHALDAATGREIWRYDPKLRDTGSATPVAVPPIGAQPCGRAACTSERSTAG